MDRHQPGVCFENLNTQLRIVNCETMTCESFFCSCKQLKVCLLSCNENFGQMFVKQTVLCMVCSCPVLSKAMLQCPNLPMIWLHTEHPHTGLTWSWLIHGRHASQRMGPVAASSVIHQQQRTLLRRAMKNQRTIVRDAGYASQRLCLLDRHNDACAKEHVLFWIIFNTSCRCKTKSQQTAQLACRFFTQKHRSTQWREDCAEDLELNLSQMLHSF